MQLLTMQLLFSLSINLPIIFSINGYISFDYKMFSSIRNPQFKDIQITMI